MLIHKHFIKIKSTNFGTRIISKKEYNIILLFGIIPLYIKVTNLMV